MPVNVKKVANRRAVRYQTLDELVQDAERMAQGPYRTLGNWSYEAILQHLAVCMNGTLDGSVLKIPWPIRTVARLIRKRLLAGEFSPGFRHTRANNAKVWSDSPPATRAALDNLRQAVARMKVEKQRHPHPALGPLTDDEWNRFHLRHSAMHMSFVVPA